MIFKDIAKLYHYASLNQGCSICGDEQHMHSNVFCTKHYSQWMKTSGAGDLVKFVNNNPDQKEPKSLTLADNPWIANVSD